MSTSFTIADMMGYNSYHRLPYQERLDYLRNNWSVTIEPEIFDSYRGGWALGSLFGWQRVV